MALGQNKLNRQARRELKRKVAKARVEKKKLEEELERTDERLRALEEEDAEANRWLHSEPIFSPAGAPSAPELMKMMGTNFPASLDHVPPKDLPHAYLLTRDWLSLVGAEHVGEILQDRPLPFPCCIFEMKISGARVAVKLEGAPGTSWVMVELKKFGAWQGFPLNKKHLAYPSVNCAVSQALALLACMEAGSCTEEVSSIPSLPNSLQGTKNPPAPLSVHTINLSKKVYPRESEGGPFGGRKPPRLHFRQGHFRYKDNPEKKRWVKWCLVGNSEESMVDTRYRA